LVLAHRYSPTTRARGHGAAAACALRASVARLVLAGTATLLAQAPLASQSFEDVLVAEPTLELQETPDHLVASPNLLPDPRGGFIYWDRLAAEARLYSETGEFKAAFGREGEGPGEFRWLVAAVRLSGGDIATVDRDGRIGRWTANGDSLLYDFSSGLAGVAGMVSLPGDRVGISTPLRVPSPDAAFADVPLLHVVDLASRSVVRTRGRARVPSKWATVLVTVAPPPPLRVGEDVYVGSPVFDSIWTIPPAGDQTGGGVRSTRLEANAEVPSLDDGRRAVLSWIGGASYLGRFVAVADGGWLVEVWGQDETRAVTRSLVRLSAGFERLWEVDGTPRLLASSPDRQRIYFWDPDGFQPNQILVRSLALGH